MRKNLALDGIVLCLAGLLQLVVLPSPALSQQWDEAIDSVMYRSPTLPKPVAIPVFSQQTKTLWLVALRRPEADYQCQAAVTVVQAHKRGMNGLETTVVPLVESLENAEQSAPVRLAAARALIELDAQAAAPVLFRQSQLGDQSLRELIEPALARWDYRPLREVWLQRLAQADSSTDNLLLAVRGLACVGEKRAIPGLRELVQSNETPRVIRLEAAQALGNLVKSGLEEQAAHLIAHALRDDVAHRLFAASLLRHHQGDQAVRLMLQLARDPEPAVAVIALGRLAEIDPKLIVPTIGQLLRSYDPEIRFFAIEALKAKPTNEHIRLLADQFHDPHPAVRIKARRGLRELAAKTQLREFIIPHAMRLLSEKDWPPLEQAAIILAQLDHKPAAKRLVELLSSNRAEVLVAAAWALRQLAVPETLAPALDHFRLLTKPVSAAKPRPSHLDLPADAIDQQLSQLAQLFGQARYAPADIALRMMVPRPMLVADPPIHAGSQARAASIWSLGLIHEGQPVPEICQGLEDRLSNKGGPRHLPEDYRVRWMSAVSLGRMKAADKLPTLRRFYAARKPSRDPINNACGWAIQQITGETMPPPGEIEVPGEHFDNWLQSLESKRGTKQ